MPTVVVENIANSGRVSLSFSYDPVIVGAIKAIVPVGSRRWDGQCWVINRAHVDKLATRLGQLGYKVVKPPLSRDNWAVTMFREADPGQREPVYCALREILTGTMLDELDRAYRRIVTKS
jgi:hypothetical protein